MTQQWWAPHPLDQYDQWRLLEIAESANPPDENHEWYSDQTMPAKDGWQVCFFYDCGSLDYIDHFITPDGEKLDVWLGEQYQSEQWPPVMNWRGVGDLERLRGFLTQNNAAITGAGTASGA